MSVIEILKSLPEINPHDCGVRYEFAGYDGVKQASSVKWCLENYARFCHVLRFITEKDGNDGFTVVYWLSHPLFEIKVENGYPLFKIYVGKDGIRNDLAPKVMPPNEYDSFINGQSVGVRFAKKTRNYALHFDIILHYAARYAWYLNSLDNPKEQENGTEEKV